MTLRRKLLGEKGEAIAKDYLLKNGYEIIRTNYRTRFGEIDIIAKTEKYLVFVEVRAKSSLNFGSAEESISRVKKAKIRRVAQSFILQEKAFKETLRFDVIAVIFNKHQELIETRHYENAF